MGEPIDPELLKIPGVRNLLGCQFGTVISVPGVDNEPCQLPAHALTVVYYNGSGVSLKLCKGHHEFVLSQTDEHKE